MLLVGLFCLFPGWGVGHLPVVMYSLSAKAMVFSLQCTVLEGTCSSAWSSCTVHSSWCTDWGW